MSRVALYQLMEDKTVTEYQLIQISRAIDWSEVRMDAGVPVRDVFNDLRQAVVDIKENPETVYFD